MTTRRTFLQTTALGIAGSAFAQTPSPAAPIDFHAHWIGPRVVELLGKRTSPRPPQGQGWFDIDARLRQMDEAGVRRQVLSYVGASYDSGPTSLVAQTIAAIRQAALTAEEKQQVLVDNGRRLLEARGIK